MGTRDEASNENPFCKSTASESGSMPMLRFRLRWVLGTNVIGAFRMGSYAIEGLRSNIVRHKHVPGHASDVWEGSILGHALTW
jgi:hypothetical protein